ncbi:UNVERIFIED_CONTAM: hypothetical protein GTU68_021591 [Idotea baltica]|nr:hypothetical protein [Idotea baltica]
MATLLIAFGAFFGFIVAYHTYGRWLARKIFALDPNATVPSCELEDGVDFVPSKKSIVFGHHFTSIAGTGPIVGPAIAVFWGWLPALLWVVLGSIFIGAVHDFGALVVSLRNKGQTVGEIAGRMIGPRAKLLFLVSLFFALTVVLAIFGLVIAIIFTLYPESVLAVWVSLPIAIVFGIFMRQRPDAILPMSILSLVLIYLAIYIGAYHLPITLSVVSNQVVGWTVILLIYCAIASVLPVSWLLQPRDYVNSHQLFVALALLIGGLIVASPAITAKADLPQETPPIWPFLFITIACGAISGFHCLVSSGTSSKQLSNETDAQVIGYGSMLLEAALAVVVILACCAGLSQTDAEGNARKRKWKDFNLGSKIGAFVEGGANFLMAIGLPLKISISIIAVLVACFAATTLDSATRLQRYVIQELGATVHLPPLKNMYVATIFAVTLGGAIAMIPDASGSMGKGGMILWPLFGATNQLLAGFAFLVTAFYLHRRNKPVWFVLLPMAFMIVLPGWALVWQMFHFDEETGSGWFFKWYAGEGKGLVTLIGCITLALQVWMVAEALIIWPKVKGVLEPAIDGDDRAADKLTASGGRSC